MAMPLVYLFTGPVVQIGLLIYRDFHLDDCPAKPMVRASHARARIGWCGASARTEVRVYRQREEEKLAQLEQIEKNEGSTKKVRCVAERHWRISTRARSDRSWVWMKSTLG